MVQFSTEAVGDSLRDQRAAAGLTLGQAANHCAIPLTYLLKIEAGATGPTAAVLRQLIALYDDGTATAPADELDLRVEKRRPRRDECEIDWVGLVEHVAELSNREILDEVATGIRALRGFGAAIPVHMREVEADIMISLLDLEDQQLIVDIMEAFSLSAVQVDEFLAASIRRFERRSQRPESDIIDRVLALPPDES